MKKFIALSILALAMAGCTSKGDDTAPDAAPPDAAPEVQPAPCEVQVADAAAGQPAAEPTVTTPPSECVPEEAPLAVE